MRRELLDRHELEPVLGDDPRDGVRREVREVLVVDRVELGVGEQRDEDGFSTVITVFASHSSARPLTKSSRSGTCAMTLFATTRRGRPCSATIASAVSRPKNSVSVSTPDARAIVGDVGSRLDAEHRDAEGEELAQQVAVVAGDLDYEASPRSARARPFILAAYARACATHDVLTEERYG